VGVGKLLNTPVNDLPGSVVERVVPVECGSDVTSWNYHVTCQSD